MSAAHRAFAGEYFNATWDLIDTAGGPGRTAADERRMLLLACASRVHWDQAGGPKEHAIGDWQVSHVLSLLGAGDLALSFAQSCLSAAQEQGWTDFVLATAHEGMARAYAVLGDKAQRDVHAGLCRAVLATLDEEERGLIGGQLDSVPEL